MQFLYERTVLNKNVHTHREKCNTKLKKCTHFDKMHAEILQIMRLQFKKPAKVLPYFGPAN